jgi:non-haem Fe2+, alpha-ketoglutarate-dependent halogenase
MSEALALDAAACNAAVQHYAAHGFAGPFRALPVDPALDLADALLREVGGPDAAFSARRNRHLDWPLVDALAQAAPIKQLAAELLGEELALWRSQMFFMHAGKGLRWHQDQYLTLLADDSRQVSVHLSLTRTLADNCIKIVPGSHMLCRVELAARGFNLIAGSEGGKYGAPNFWRDPASELEALPMLLEPGEFFVFHPRLLHGSRDVTVPDNVRPARGSEPHPRVGLGLRIAAAGNTVFPAAFAETLPRPDRCVRLG